METECSEEKALRSHTAHSSKVKPFPGKSQLCGRNSSNLECGSHTCLCASHLHQSSMVQNEKGIAVLIFGVGALRPIAL